MKRPFVVIREIGEKTDQTVQAVSDEPARTPIPAASKRHNGEPVDRWLPAGLARCFCAGNSMDFLLRTRCGLRHPFAVCVCAWLFLVAREFFRACCLRVSTRAGDGQIRID